MDTEISAELRARIKDPADLPKFERLYRLVDRRLRKRGVEDDMAAVSAITMQAWREVFGAEWPATKAVAKGKAARRARAEAAR